MIDQTTQTNTDNTGKIFSDSIANLLDDLDCLYVIDNLSGRLRFRKNWPSIAPLIFPTDLMHVDEFGSEDKPYRKKLEKEADTLRIGLIKKIKSIQKEHQINSALNSITTKAFIEELGNDAVIDIFQQHIIQKLSSTLSSTPKSKPTPMIQPIEKEPPQPEGAEEPRPPIIPEKINYKALFNIAAALY